MKFWQTATCCTHLLQRSLLLAIFKLVITSRHSELQFPLPVKGSQIAMNITERNHIYKLKSHVHTSKPVCFGEAPAYPYIRQDKNFTLNRNSNFGFETIQSQPSTTAPDSQIVQLALKYKLPKRKPNFKTILFLEFAPEGTLQICSHYRQNFPYCSKSSSKTLPPELLHDF